MAVCQWHWQKRWWITSGQPQWSNIFGPPADEQWHLVPIADHSKMVEQNSGGLLVAAISGLLMSC
jgi:hypothetical protein